MAVHTWRFMTTGALDPAVTPFSPSVGLDLGVGTNTGYRFTLDGRLTATKHATLTSAATVTTSLRRTIANQAGTWFYATGGKWKGYWLRESDAVALSGGSFTATALDAQVFDPQAVVVIRMGTHTGYTFSATGVMTGSRTATVSRREGSAAEVRALPGQTGMWFRMTSGKWSGFWLRASSVVTLSAGG